MGKINFFGSYKSFIEELTNKYESQKVCVIFKSLNERINEFIKELSKKVDITINLSESESVRAIVVFCEDNFNLKLPKGKECYKIMCDFNSMFNLKEGNALLVKDFLKISEKDIAVAFSYISGSIIAAQNMLNAKILFNYAYASKGMRLLKVIEKAIINFQSGDLNKVCESVKEYALLESETSFSEFCPCNAALKINNIENKLIYAVIINGLYKEFYERKPFFELNSFNTIGKLKVAKLYGFNEETVKLNLLAFWQNKIVIYKLKEFFKELAGINNKITLTLKECFIVYKRLSVDGGFKEFSDIENNKLIKTVFNAGLFIKPNLISIMNNLGLIS